MDRQDQAPTLRRQATGKCLDEENGFIQLTFQLTQQLEIRNWNNQVLEKPLKMRRSMPIFSIKMLTLLVTISSITFSNLSDSSAGLGSFGVPIVWEPTTTVGSSTVNPPKADPTRNTSGHCLLPEEFGVSEDEVWEGHWPPVSTSKENGPQETGNLQAKDETGLGNQFSEGTVGQEQLGRSAGRAVDQLSKESQHPPKKQRQPQTRRKQQERHLSTQEKKRLSIPKTQDPEQLMTFAKGLENYRSRTSAFSAAKVKTLLKVADQLIQNSKSANSSSSLYGSFLKLRYGSRTVNEKTILNAEDYLSRKKFIDHADIKLCICLCLRPEKKSVQVLAAKKFATQLRTKKQVQNPSKVLRLIKRFEGMVRFDRLVGREMILDGTDIDGNSFQISDLNGKVVLVHFWGTECNDCDSQLTALNKIHQEWNPAGMEIVGVSSEKNLTRVYSHLEKNGVTWTNLASEGERNKAYDYYGIITVPTYVLIGRDGKVVATGLHLKRMKKEVEQLFENEKN